MLRQNACNLAILYCNGVDEENISEGSHDIINSGLLENTGFIISGESGEVKAHHQPFNVCYGRKGRILFDAYITGVRAHAARSREGVNAISKASELVRWVFKDIVFILR